MRFNRDGLKTRNNPLWQSLLFFVVSALVAAGVYGFLNKKESTRLEEKFDNYSKTKFHMVEDLLENANSHLESMRDFYNASEFVTRDEFRIISREFLENNRYIQALNWVPVVRGEERIRYETSARRDGIDRFSFRAFRPDSSIIKSPEKQKYMPVYYFEPHAGNEDFAGMDLRSDSKLLEGMQKAAETSEIVAVTPSSSALSDYSLDAMFLLSPVFNKESSGSEKEVAGFIVGIFKFRELIREAFDGDLSLINNFHMFDKEKGRCLHVKDWPGLLDCPMESADTIRQHCFDLKSGEEVRVRDFNYAGKDLRMVSLRPESLVSE
ncbi:MAG: hypothetical protein GF417_04600, partial [Candidatus Latescibacteria bacterium]|nr:hypothetical protein [Candidatus Latescibacterota bacterium]